MLRAAYTQGIKDAQYKFAADPSLADLLGLTGAERAAEDAFETAHTTQSAEVKKVLEDIKKAPAPGTAAFDAEAKELLRKAEGAKASKSVRGVLKQLPAKLLRKGR